MGFVDFFSCHHNFVHVCPVKLKAFCAILSFFELLSMSGGWCDRRTGVRAQRGSGSIASRGKQKNDEKEKRRHLPNSEGWSQKQNQSWTGEHHSGNSSSWRVSPMIDDRKGWLDQDDASAVIRCLVSEVMRDVGSRKWARLSRDVDGSATTPWKRRSFRTLLPVA